ncbi:MAG TPA: AraC family transcriptional regulator [Opitutaceae bacterium]
MPKREADYFRYFPVAPDFACWGVWVTAAGFTRVPAGVPYPPRSHPADHHFDWERGRVLDAWQIVLITAGRGELETRAVGRREIGSGMAFLLTPGEWHRYRPSRRTGWEESWLELQGPTPGALARAGILSAQHPLREAAMATGLETALAAVHACARASGPGFDPELVARAFAVLAAWERAGEARTLPPRVAQAVARAERHLVEHLAEPVNIEQLACELGLAYSHFRRAFKAHTGFAPWQYVLHQRLARARRLLASGDEPLEAIAARLGFSSAFHLSKLFKQATGFAPAHWRRRLIEGRLSAGGRVSTRQPHGETMPLRRAGKPEAKGL